MTDFTAGAWPHAHRVFNPATYVYLIMSLQGHCTLVH